jgi:hypothetical protein
VQATCALLAASPVCEDKDPLISMMINMYTEQVLSACFWAYVTYFSFAALPPVMPW